MRERLGESKVRGREETHKHTGSERERRHIHIERHTKMESANGSGLRV